MIIIKYLFIILCITAIFSLIKNIRLYILAKKCIDLMDKNRLVKIKSNLDLADELSHIKYTLPLPLNKPIEVSLQIFNLIVNSDDLHEQIKYIISYCKIEINNEIIDNLTSILNNIEKINNLRMNNIMYKLQLYDEVFTSLRIDFKERGLLNINRKNFTKRIDKLVGLKYINRDIVSMSFIFKSNSPSNKKYNEYNIKLTRSLISEMKKINEENHSSNS